MSENNKQLSPIKNLLDRSWQLFTSSILSLILLNIVSYFLYFVLAVVGFLLFIITGFGSALIKGGTEGVVSSLAALDASGVIAITGIVAVGVVGMIFIGSAITTAAILMLDSEGKLPLLKAFKKGLALVIPLSIMGFISLFLTFGGLFVFVIPSIIMMFLFSFASFEVMLNNKSPMEALKRSVTIISNNFGALFTRWIVIIAIYFVVTAFLPNLIGGINETMKFYSVIISFFVNWLAGWYVLAYDIALYKEVKDSIDSKKTKSLTWMWVVAILGWMIFGLLAFGGWKLVTSDTFQEGIKSEISGKAASLILDPKAKAHLDKSEELVLKITSENTSRDQAQKLNDDNIGELKKALEIEPNSALLWFRLGRAYLWVNSTGSSEVDGLAAFQKAVALDPDNSLYIDNVAEMLINTGKYEEAVFELQKSLRIGIDEGNESGLTHYRLGVAYGRLNVNDEAIAHFEKAIEILQPYNDDGKHDETILSAQKNIAELSK